MKSTKSLSDIEALRILEGEVTAVQEATNSVSVDLGEYSVIAEVPLSYLCQDGDTLYSYAAFHIADVVLVEWNVPVVESPTPTKDSCRVLGFSDGVPRLCFTLIAIYNGDRVAFYNLITGRCQVVSVDPIMVATTWSGGTVGVDDWAYYKVAGGTTTTAFIDAVLGDTGEDLVDSAIEGVEATLGVEVDTVSTVGPSEPEWFIDDPAYVYEPARTYAPAASYAAGDDARPVTQSGYNFKGGYYVHSGYQTALITITDTVAPLLLNGLDIMPEEWVSHYEQTKIECATVPGHEARLEVRDYENPGSYTLYSPCCWAAPPLTLPEYDEVSLSSPPTNCTCPVGGDGARWNNRCCCNKLSYKDQQVLVDQSFVDFIDPTCFFLGEDGTEITLPVYTGQPTPAAEALFSKGATQTKFDSHLSISKSNGTEGYLIGKREGQDWNWENRDELTIPGVYYPLRSYITAELTAPIDESPCLGFKYCGTTARIRYTWTYFSGDGHKVNHDVYRNMQTGAEAIYKADSVYRSVKTVYQEYRAYTTIWYAECEDSQDTAIGAANVSEEETITINKVYWSGEKHILAGKLNQRCLLGVDVKATATSGGWQDLPYSEPARTLVTASLFSAIREESADPASEWAEGRVQWDDSLWIAAFVNNAQAAAGYTNVEPFIDLLKFRALPVV